MEVFSSAPPTRDGHVPEGHLRPTRPAPTPVFSPFPPHIVSDNTTRESLIETLYSTIQGPGPDVVLVIWTLSVTKM